MCSGKPWNAPVVSFMVFIIKCYLLTVNIHFNKTHMRIHVGHSGSFVCHNISVFSPHKNSVAFATAAILHHNPVLI